MTGEATFEVDRDTVRSVRNVVEYRQVSQKVATLTTDGNHNFAVGWQVEISGVGEPFDGIFTITGVPSPDTFEYDLNVSDISVNALALSGQALSPAPSYLKYNVNDTVLDSLGSVVAFTAETWDYHTIRISWKVDDEVEAKAQDDLSDGLTPRVRIVRSGFGYPVTPMDGIIVLDEAYTDIIGTADRPSVKTVLTFGPETDDGAYVRPINEGQTLYDRGLPSGRWFYYSIFFFLKGTSPSASWRLGGSMDALIPSQAGHAEKLYELIPQYYRSKDGEFADGTGLSGTVKRLLSVVGMEADYTKTFADGLERIYDLDYVHDDLLHALGESNFGVYPESGLGDIRYRSLLATVSKLYNERGSAAGITRMTQAATKYRCKVLEGINLLNLTDDAEFLSGTGAWGDISGAAYADFLDAYSWLDAPAGSLSFGTPTIGIENPVVTTSTTSPLASIVLRRNVMTVEGTSGPIIITCGLGTGAMPGRRHTPEEVTFYPRLNGIKCRSGNVYIFSAHCLLQDGETSGNVSVGILWFNEPVGASFNVMNDFLDNSPNAIDYSTPEPDAEYGDPFIRYSVESVAPLSSRGQAYVFAVPFISFDNSSKRYVSACMFNGQLNAAANFAVNPDNYLTLGDPSELLGSDAVLGG